MVRTCSLLLVFCTCVPFVLPSKILAVFPTVSKSHFDFFQPLLLELASRGHQLTVINSYPQPLAVQNYTDISIRDFTNVFFNNLSVQVLPRVPITFADNHQFLYSQIVETRKTFSHPEVQRLLHSEEHFDLVITELWNSDVYLGFADRFKAPAIVMSSCTLLPWANARFANPDNPSYIPNAFLHKMGPLSFWEKLVNTVELAVSKFLYVFFYDREAQRIADLEFGGTSVALDVLARNTSLLFVNTHHSLHGARPFTPQVVEVGGLHVKPSRPLDKDLDKWMNESTDGVIYFSFGSMLRGATLPLQKVNAFLEVFKKLPQRVLWKWEDDAVEGLPDNVKIMHWLPQRDVLAHPKVKVFISHGGLLGSTEAVVSGVPILGIPMYGDQPNNVAALVHKGVAIHVDYNNISVESLTYALNALLYDKSYSEKAQQLSREFLDRPLSPLDTAVYWTEYVIRHRGAPHLRSAAVDLPWYQYYLLDVLATIILGLAAIVTIVFYVLFLLLRFVYKLVAPKNYSKTKLN